MGSEWQTFKLAEVYDFCSGLSKPRSEFGSGFPFYRLRMFFIIQLYQSSLLSLFNRRNRSGYAVPSSEVMFF